MYDNCVVLLNDNSYSLENIKKIFNLQQKKKNAYIRHIFKRVTINPLS